MKRAVYGGVNQAVARMIPRPSGNILDLGCGDGSFGAWLQASGDCRVTGVTIQGTEAQLARERLPQVIEADLDRWDPPDAATYDGIVASHVLEHLADPSRLLRSLRRTLRPGGWLVVGLPNILFWRQRLHFLLGRFRYTQGGLMDDTHLRFFDWHSAHQLLTASGWSVDESIADGGLPGSRWTGPLRPTLDRSACRLRPGLFGFQFVFRASLPAQSTDDVRLRNP